MPSATTPPPGLPAAARPANAVHPAAAGGSRSPAGSTYGDFAPRTAPPGMADPSRGAELERDLEPGDAPFDRVPDATSMFDSGTADAESAGLKGEALDGASPAPDTREARVREAAYRRYEERGGGPGDADSDWLAAEAEVDASGTITHDPGVGRIGAAGARQRNAEGDTDSDAEAGHRR